MTVPPEPGPSSPDPEDLELSLHGLSEAPADEPPPAPDAGFTFVRELGRGGMGVVYEAVEDATQRRVAVKVMTRGVGRRPDAADRFHREARLAAAISHANCVFVYGAHRVHDAPAISMELMPGKTLDDRLKSGDPIPVATAVGWAIDVLNGLEAAHDLGIVHRDVKPSNCFLTADGRVKVGDFGLSRSADTDLNLTQSGVFIGSPLYCSPEQARGHEVDRRADVYSVGATLHALLAGRPPFEGRTLADVLVRIASEDPPSLHKLRPDVAPGLAKIVARALAKDPAKRFQSCAALRQALVPFGPGSLTAATLGVRVGAFVLDSLLVSVTYSAVATGLGALGADVGTSGLVLDAGSPIPDRQSPILGCGDSVRPDHALTAAWLAIGVGFAWFALFETLLGATPGKRHLGLRVVQEGGSRPRAWRAALRAATFLLPHAVSLTVFVGFSARPVFMLAAYLAPLITMRKRNGYRGIHELVSGTRVLRPSGEDAVDRTATFDPGPEAAADLPHAVGACRVLGLVGRTARGPVVVARDPALERDVWIDLAPGVAWEHATRPACLRHVHRSETPVPHDVYEAPGGGPLADYAATQRPLEWPVVVQYLIDLVDELAARETGAAPGQLWIDRRRRLRVLDFALGPGEPQSAVATLQTAAKLLLAPAGTPAAPRSLPAPSAGPQAAAPALRGLLPLHAEDLVARLLGSQPAYRTLDEARDALRDVATRDVVLSTERRAAQIFLAIAWVGSATAVGLVPGLGAAAVPVIAGVTVLVPIVLSWFLRGGLTFSVLGVGIRTARGAPASRARCVLRAVVVWLPALLAVGVACASGVQTNHAVAAASCVYSAGAVWSAARPARGPADAVAKTVLVRR